MLGDEIAHLAQLLLRRRRQIQNRYVSIANRAEQRRFRKLGAQIEHRSYSRSQSALCLAATELAANPDIRRNLIPGSTLPSVIEQRQILADQARPEHEAGARGQFALAFAKNNRPDSKIARGDEAESKARAKQQKAPGHK